MRWLFEHFCWIFPHITWHSRHSSRERDTRKCSLLLLLCCEQQPAWAGDKKIRWDGTSFPRHRWNRAHEFACHGLISLVNDEEMALVPTFTLLLLILFGTVRPQGRVVQIFHLIDNTLWGEIDGTGLQGNHLTLSFHHHYHHHHRHHFFVCLLFSLFLFNHSVLFWYLWLTWMDERNE